MPRPFVYIAALRRSGSNLLAEALSRPPLSFCFREPGVARGNLRWKPRDRELLAEHGIDLDALRKDRPEDRGERLADFCERVLPALGSRLEQVAIKEIKHGGWRDLLERLPDTRIVLTGRDPRDVYLSLHAKRADRGIAFQGELSPAGVSEEILRTFADQRAMLESRDCHRVRYEDLCRDPAAFTALVGFIDSPLPAVGLVGGLNRHNVRAHGDQITTRSVERWRQAGDARLVAEAQETFERVADYAAFWGYR